MDAHELDNPILSALRDRHRGFALAHGAVLRFPAEVAPFLAVPDDRMDADAALAALVPPGGSVFGLGPAPRTPAGWQSTGPFTLAQMVCEAPLPEPPGPAIVALGAGRRADVLELAALVYPHYFRPRTPELGRYFGIYQDGRLAAMAGERLGSGRWREVSAVCAHPDHAGRGLARRVLAWLSNDILARGQLPFLHVSVDNHRALALYLRNGYAVRREIAHWGLSRP